MFKEGDRVVCTVDEPYLGTRIWIVKSYDKISNKVYLYDRAYIVNASCLRLATLLEIELQS